MVRNTNAFCRQRIDITIFFQEMFIMKTLSEDFNKLTVVKGETFDVMLSANPSTGYGWELAVKQGKASLLNEAFVGAAQSGEVCGGDAYQIFTFRAEETGILEIDGVYKRSWEAPSAKDRKQHFMVTVK